jgi:hypothetical protein
MFAVADVEIGFIQRQRLNARGIAGENFADMVRGFVGIKAAGKQREMRAQLERRRRRHGAAHAKLTRRIVRGTNHAALYPTAAYREISRNAGLSRISTAAKKQSISTWIILRIVRLNTVYPYSIAKSANLMLFLFHRLKAVKT